MPLVIKQVLVEKLRNELSFFLSDYKPDIIAGKHSSSTPLMTRPKSLEIRRKIGSLVQTVPYFLYSVSGATHT